MELLNAVFRWRVVAVAPTQTAEGGEVVLGLRALKELPKTEDEGLLKRCSRTVFVIQVGAEASCLLVEAAHEVMLKRQVWAPRGRESCEDSLLKEQLQMQSPRSERGVDYLVMVEQPL